MQFQGRPHPWNDIYSEANIKIIGKKIKLHDPDLQFRLRCRLSEVAELTDHWRATVGGTAPNSEKLKWASDTLSIVKRLQINLRQAEEHLGAYSQAPLTRRTLPVLCKTIEDIERALIKSINEFEFQSKTPKSHGWDDAGRKTLHDDTLQFFVFRLTEVYAALFPEAPIRKSNGKTSKTTQFELFIRAAATPYLKVTYKGKPRVGLQEGKLHRQIQQVVSKANR